jgi:murein DD-endopeptidase MepM/ murein hydrolase activator NlpD
MHRRLTLLAALVLAGAACTSDDAATDQPAASVAAASTTVATSTVRTAPPATTLPVTSTTSTTTLTTAITLPATTLPASTLPASTGTSTTVAPADVRHVYPVQDAANTSFGETHSGYPATDIFHTGGCGARLVSPVDGVVLEVRRDNEWDPAVDDPDTRGGRTVAIEGDDAVRYYLAHFQLIDDAVQPGLRVAAGDPLGELGDSGRTSACHLHFGLSPVCPNDEWWVRRGVIWPYPYLRDWRDGVNTSPLPEITAWQADHPDACTTPPGGDAGDAG